MGYFNEILRNENNYVSTANSPTDGGIVLLVEEPAQIGGHGTGDIGPVDLAAQRAPVEQQLVLLDQLVAEDEVGHGTGERAHGKEYHAPGYPLGPVALATVIRQQQGRADLADLRGRHYQTRRLRLDLEELLDRRDDRDEVREVHALENLLQKREDDFTVFWPLLHFSQYS